MLLAVALATVALGVALYLSVQAIFDSPVAGCGASGGCGAVLASPWSKVGPVPVSLLGVSVYVAVLGGLALRWVSPGSQKAADFVLLAASPAMLVSAAWFTYVQFVEIGEFCPYCMVDHGIGVLLGVMLPVKLLTKGSIKPAGPMLLGVAGGLGMIGMQQLLLWEDTQSTDNRFVDQDGDLKDGDKRYISMFGGELQFELSQTPHIGQTDAKQVIGVVFDYACPHCRATHMLLDKAIEDDPHAFTIVPLPISINASHNPYLQSDNKRFNESYELARLSLAVGAVDMNKWKDFDRWLFAEEPGATFPRSLVDAIAKAVQLVGEDAINAQLTDAALAQHEAVLKRNIELMALIPEDRRAIPVVTSPGAPRHLTERFYEIDVLEELLRQAETGLSGKPRESAQP